MRSSGALLRELENREISDYVSDLAETIAAHSDLKTPLKVSVLESEEINAFTLPGGFLFVNTALIEQAENESQLTGVLAHEISPVTARHGARFTKKAEIAKILYQ